MPQDFWTSSGFSLLAAGPRGLVTTDKWLAHLLDREELRPPQEAGPRERELHRALATHPRTPVALATIDALEDPTARHNWSEFLRFRDRVLGFDTLEDAYRDFFRGPAVDVPPVFVDLLAQVITRAALDGVGDATVLRAGEMMFRLQRVAAEGGQVLSADAATVEAFARTGGFGNVGRLLRSQDALPPVKMDVLTAENASFYFLRDELYSFALDLTPGRDGARALARVLERWVGRMAGVSVSIEPVPRIDDPRWRWHVGLDADSSALLNALYRGETVAGTDLERMLALFRLEFRDPGDAIGEMSGRPVYLGLACRPDRTLKLKPQNLLTGLPLRKSGDPRG